MNHSDATSSSETAGVTGSFYWEVTRKILQAMEKGVTPWRQTWGPRNACTRRHYRGINILLLNLWGFPDPRWLTAKQAQRMGGFVREGEPGALIVTFYRSEFAAPDDAHTESISSWRPRFHTVYNATQCEIRRLPPWAPPPGATGEALAAAASIVQAMPSPPVLQHGGDGACYYPLEDWVSMPHQASFDSESAYYATLFHELVHSTGHPGRLNREEIARPNAFGSDPYALEELVAEVGAAFLCAAAGLDGAHDESAAYLDGWLKVLKPKPRWEWLAIACNQAQRADDYIRG